MGKLATLTFLLERPVRALPNKKRVAPEQPTRRTTVFFLGSFLLAVFVPALGCSDHHDNDNDNRKGNDPGSIAGDRY
jgi:hypothetical protein